MNEILIQSSIPLAQNSVNRNPTFSGCPQAFQNNQLMPGPQSHSFYFSRHLLAPIRDVLVPHSPLWCYTRGYLVVRHKSHKMLSPGLRPVCYKGEIRYLVKKRTSPPAGRVSEANVRKKRKRKVAKEKEKKEYNLYLYIILYILFIYNIYIIFYILSFGEYV